MTNVNNRQLPIDERVKNLKTRIIIGKKNRRIHDYNTITLHGKSISDPKSGTQHEKNHTKIQLKSNFPCITLYVS